MIEILNTKFSFVSLIVAIILILSFIIIGESVFQIPHINASDPLAMFPYRIAAMVILAIAITILFINSSNLLAQERQLMIGLAIGSILALWAYKIAYIKPDRFSIEFIGYPFYIIIGVSLFSMIWGARQYVVMLIRQSDASEENQKENKSPGKITNIPFEKFTTLTINENLQFADKVKSGEAQFKLGSEKYGDAPIMIIDGQAFTLLYFLAKETEAIPNYSDRIREPWLLEPWRYKEILSKAFYLINFDLKNYLVKA